MTMLRKLKVVGREITVETVIGRVFGYPAPGLLSWLGQLYNVQRDGGSERVPEGTVAHRS